MSRRSKIKLLQRWSERRMPPLLRRGRNEHRRQRKEISRSRHCMITMAGYRRHFGLRQLPARTWQCATYKLPQLTTQSDGSMNWKTSHSSRYAFLARAGHGSSHVDAGDVPDIKVEFVMELYGFVVDAGAGTGDNHRHHTALCPKFGKPPCSRVAIYISRPGDAHCADLFGEDSIG